MGSPSTFTYRYIFVVQELPNFLTRDLVTLNTTRSISHSPRSILTVKLKIREKAFLKSETRTSVTRLSIFHIFL